MNLLAGTYSISLVFLSVFIAVFASYAAFHIAGLVIHTNHANKHLWTAGGAVSLGGGIWSMHFVAMLAYDMGMPVSYDPLLLTVSIMLAVLSSWAAFAIIQFSRPRLLYHAAGSCLVGTGIISMHYVGVEAMQMPASISYNPWLVFLSVVIAVGASFTALRLFSSVLDTPDRSLSQIAYISSAAVMGAAISGMHYTGMAAASFQPD